MNADADVVKALIAEQARHPEEAAASASEG
jgi:hypothetical protein